MQAPSPAGQPDLRAGAGAAGRGGALGGADKRSSHVVPVAAAASVRAGRGGSAPSERAEARSRAGAGRKGGAAGWRVGRVGGRRRGARPGCRGRLAQREPARLSLAAPCPEHLREDSRQRRIHVQR